MIERLLLLGLGIVTYTYLGYGILLTLLVRCRRMHNPVLMASQNPDDTPHVTLVITACNAMRYLPAKLLNVKALDYPTDKLQLLFVTEGSADGSTEWLQSVRDDGDYQIHILGGTTRRAKVAAVNRAMMYVKSPVVVFSDASTPLNQLAIRQLIRHFQDTQVGAVVGETRVDTGHTDSATGLAEGLYHHYESYLNRIEAQWHTVAGSTGALFAIRTSLYKPVEPDTLLGDFMLSLRIAAKGYRIAYESNAYTLQQPLPSIAAAQSREVATAAGGLQAIRRLLPLLNVVRFGWLSFQYVSHWVLRWAVAPVCLPLIWLCNLALLLTEAATTANYLLLTLLFAGQCLFYITAYIGYRLHRTPIRHTILFVPFYFTFMNACAMLGFIRYWRGNATDVRKKVRRVDDVTLRPVDPSV